MSPLSAKPALLFGEYTFPTRNRLAATAIERLATRHANADSFVGLDKLLPRLGAGVVAETAVLLTQLPVYKNLAWELTAIYEGPIEAAIRSYLNAGTATDAGTTLGAETAFGEAQRVLAAQLGTEFLTEIAPDLAHEIAVGRARARRPLVGVCVAVAGTMIWRVGTMISIYYQNRAAWVRDRKETYQRAKIVTGGLAPDVADRVNLDEVPRKVAEVFESQLGLVGGYLERLRKFKPTADRATLRKHLHADGIPDDLAGEAIARIYSDYNEKSLVNLLVNRQNQTHREHESGEGPARVGEEKQQNGPDEARNQAERVQPSAEDPNAVPIQLAEIARAESEADAIQTAGIELVQRTLKGLAGRRAEPKEGKEIADRARKLAKRFGVSLHFNGEPVYFKWGNGVFTATTTDSTHEHIASSVEFLPLTVPEIGPPAAGAVDDTPAGSHATKVQARRSKKDRRAK